MSRLDRSFLVSPKHFIMYRYCCPPPPQLINREIEKERVRTPHNESLLIGTDSHTRLVTVMTVTEAQASIAGDLCGVIDAGGCWSSAAPSASEAPAGSQPVRALSSALLEGNRGPGQRKTTHRHVSLLNGLGRVHSWAAVH